MPIPMSSDEIADDLEDRIYDGDYPPGSKMPPHRELAVLYEVSMTTMTGIMRILRERGLTRGRQGKGVYVVERLPPPRKR
jgi:DNA-binding GntR family transcriptional regulator